MASDWHMPRAAHTCSACGRAFEAGEEFRANLYEAEAGYARRDFCAACEPPAMPFPLASWRARGPRTTEAKRHTFDREALLAFFEQMEPGDVPERRQFRFVLGLLLWRKKLLRFEGADERGGAETWRFHAARGERVFEVERPEIAEDELERLSLQLDQLMSGETPGEPNSVAASVLKEVAETES